MKEVQETEGDWRNYGTCQSMWSEFPPLVLDLEEPWDLSPHLAGLWHPFILPWSRPQLPVLGQLYSVQPLSPQCPPNLHKLDGYYCDHEQV